MSNDRSGESFQGGGEASKNIHHHRNQTKLERLKSLRENVDWEIEKERGEFLRRLGPLIDDWQDELPNLRDIFRRDEIDRLLTESVKADSLEFIDFVDRSGYKDEPDVDENGKPSLLRRTTAIHHAARSRPTRWFIAIPELFKIYDRFDANYVAEDGSSTHFHAACMLPACREVVARFLELGQNPDCLAQSSSLIEPPLLVALSFRNLSAAEALLRAGADPNLASKDGFTALHVIFQNSRGDEEMMAFFGILEDTQQKLLVAVDAKDKWGWTPLQLAVTSLLPRCVDELLARGASLTSFVFPTSEIHFDRCFDAWLEDKDHKLRLASAALSIVERLEKAGYELERAEALTIMKLFAEHGMFDESDALADGRWYRDKRFARAAKKMMMKKKKKKDLSLHDLIPLSPKEAARLLAVGDYYEFVGAVRFSKLPRGSHDACAVHLCEKLSRGFFRRWALDPFRELIRYPLPLECCDIILDLLTNKDLYYVCSAAAGHQRP